MTRDLEAVFRYFRIVMSDTYVFFQSVQDEGFELTQAFVDPGSSPFLHDGFG